MEQLLIILAVFFFCMLIGMPIAICMGSATLVYFLMLPTSNFILMLPSGMFQGIDSFVLMAVPFSCWPGN